jgi:hypothetical protein
VRDSCFTQKCEVWRLGYRTLQWYEEEVINPGACQEAAQVVHRERLSSLGLCVCGCMWMGACACPCLHCSKQAEADKLAPASQTDAV